MLRSCHAVNARCWSSLQVKPTPRDGLDQPQQVLDIGIEALAVLAWSLALLCVGAAIGTQLL